MQEHDEPIVETGIPCFRCDERSGIDCAGRKPDEATLCEPCFKEHMAEEREKQARHQASFLEGVYSGGGAAKARELWDVLTEEDREGVRKILGDASIKRILKTTMNEPLVRKLKRICSDVAYEIDTASQAGDHTLFAAAVKARDALVEMRAAAGCEVAAKVVEEHYSFDEMRAMAASAGYSGIGCPDCGPDADVEGRSVEIDGSNARQEVSCSNCDKVWVNRYRFDGEEGPLG